MNRTNCIFCKNPLDNSDEHVIPEALNGKLHSKKIICSDCNALFGSTIDPEIKRQLNPLLLIFGFPNANAVIASSLTSEKYVLGQNLQAKPVKPKVLISKKDGRTGLKISGTQKEIKGIIRKLNKITEKRPYRFEQQNENKYSQRIHGLSTEFKLDLSSKIKLLFNKIAIEYYAIENIDLSCLNALTDKVRTLDYDLNNVTFCNFQGEVRDFNHDEISHLIVLKNDNNVLYSYIELFNLVCGVVVLSDTYNGEEVFKSYHQDALTKKIFLADIKLKISINDIVKKSTLNDNFENLNNELSERFKNRQFDQTLDHYLKRILADLKSKADKGEINNDEVRDFYLKKSGEMIAWLTIHKFPYILEDEKHEENDEYNFIHSNFREEIADEFINRHNHLLNIRLKNGDDVYLFVRFHKEQVKVKKDKYLIRIYCVLEAVETEEIFHVPVGELFQQIRAGIEETKKKQK